MSEKPNDLKNTWDEVDELGDDFFQQADLFHGNQLVRRGRPKAQKTKKPISIRLDAEVVDYFKSTGAGWQTRINGVLSNWVKAQEAAK